MLSTIKQQIVQYGQLLVERGLVAGSWGNISARAGELIIITPSGSNYSTLTPADLVTVNLQGQVVDGHRPPSSELPCHLAVYSAYPQARAVIHTHSIYASACATAHKSIPAIIEDMAQIVGPSVNLAEYALLGTQQLADNCIAAMGENSAVLMANHGVLTRGHNLQEAFIAAEVVEKTAHIYILAQQLGGATVLSTQDVEYMRRGYLDKYRCLQTGE